MQNTSTVTTKYQVVIPKQVRKTVSIKAGDQVIVQALGNVIIVQPKNRKQGWAEELLGLGRDIWEDIDPVTYVRNERKAWKK